MPFSTDTLSQSHPYTPFFQEIKCFFAQFLRLSSLTAKIQQFLSKYYLKQHIHCDIVAFQIKTINSQLNTNYHVNKHQYCNSTESPVTLHL